MTAGVAANILAPIMCLERESVVRAIRGCFFVAPTTNIQQGRCIPFSPVDPKVGSRPLLGRATFGATQSHLVRRGKGADECSLTFTSCRDSSPTTAKTVEKIPKKTLDLFFSSKLPHRKHEKYGK